MAHSEMNALDEMREVFTRATSAASEHDRNRVLAVLEAAATVFAEPTEAGTDVGFRGFSRVARALEALHDAVTGNAPGTDHDDASPVRALSEAEIDAVTQHWVDGWDLRDLIKWARDGFGRDLKDNPAWAMEYLSEEADAAGEDDAEAFLQSLLADRPAHS